MVRLTDYPGAQYARNAEPYSDEDAYSFEPGGILRTFLAKTNTTTYFAAGAWDFVKTEDGHGPGGPHPSTVPITDTIL